MKENPKISKDEAFNKCAKSSNKIYDEKLINLVKNT